MRKCGVLSMDHDMGVGSGECEVGEWEVGSKLMGGLVKVGGRWSGDW